MMLYCTCCAAQLTGTETHRCNTSSAHSAVLVKLKGNISGASFRLRYLAQQLLIPHVAIVQAADALLHCHVAIQRSA